jgi:hypothetical protein
MEIGDTFGDAVNVEIRDEMDQCNILRALSSGI